MRLAGVASAFPAHYYDQETLSAALARRWKQHGGQVARMQSLHRRVQVGGRHLALPLEDYEGLNDWGDANRVWQQEARRLGGLALTSALARAGCVPHDVDLIIFVSVTGLATPSVDAGLINDLGLRPDVRRLPLFGLGCVAGAAGIARAADHLRGHPHDTVALVAVELCSLTLQPGDLSAANLIATGLFGDGAAAVVMNSRGTGPEIVSSRSVFYPGTEEIMGWEIGRSGFRVILSANLPALVARHLRADVDAFLADAGLDRASMERVVAHPGGPRILEAMATALELPGGALDVTWESLSRHGNISSVSVLLVLEAHMGSPPPAGSYGLLLAMGPGFCTELVLLRWP